MSIKKSMHVLALLSLMMAPLLARAEYTIQYVDDNYFPASAPLATSNAAGQYIVNEDGAAYVYTDGVGVSISALGGYWQTDAAVINSKGVVAGTYRNEFDHTTKAFLYYDGQITEIGGALYTTVGGLNDSGTVIASGDLGYYVAGFVSTGGEQLQLECAVLCSMLGINNAGTIVGHEIGYTDYGAAYNFGFVYVDGRLTDLNSLIAAGSEWNIQSAVAVDAAGVITAVACHGSIADGFDGCGTVLLDPNPRPTVSAVPEPGTYGMFLLGFVFTGWMARRRTRGAP